MRVGVIGAGHIGSGIARFLVHGGHEVIVSSASGNGLEQLASELGVRAVSPARAVNAAKVPVPTVESLIDDAGFAPVRTGTLAWAAVGRRAAMTVAREALPVRGSRSQEARERHAVITRHSS